MNLDQSFHASYSGEYMGDSKINQMSKFNIHSNNVSMFKSKSGMNSAFQQSTNTAEIVVEDEMAFER